MNRKTFLVSPEALESGVSNSKVATHTLKADFQDFRLGVLDNGKGNADHLLRMLVERAKKSLPISSVVWIRKTSMSHPSQKDIYENLAAETDFVLSAIAD